MEKFTFLTLAFNQEKYIERHLESIRRLVTTYGKSILIDWILSDDCSTDGTVECAKKWLESENDNIFNRVLILEHDKNQGTVRNLLDGVNHVRTRDFKLLAADDYYRDEDIFSLYDNVRNKMIITPLHIVGNEDPKMIRYFSEIYSIVKRHASNLRMKKLLDDSCDFIPAPGVIFDGDFARDRDFQIYMLQFKFLEDYPMWHYFVNTFKCNIEVLSHPYINYNLGSGLSTNRSHGRYSDFKLERDKIAKQFKIKTCMLPRYINPYKYFYKIAGKIFYAADKLKIIFGIGRNDASN